MKILVTGGKGMVGHGFRHPSSPLATNHEFICLGSSDYDLTQFEEARRMVNDHAPDAIVHLAARVGGVKGNTDYVADFYSENTLINTHVLQAAHEGDVKRLVSLLSPCVYPDKVTYPLTEDQVHNGDPHPSNFGYAYAKRMLEVQSRALRAQYERDYICAIPNNLYGPEDNFDLENGHVLPAVIRKIWEAKINGEPPTFWGDGSPLREFTYAPDIANALVYLLENYHDAAPVNIGLTKEQTIASAVERICNELDYEGDILWDKDKPAGQYKKPSSNQRFLDLGWREADYTSFEKGIADTCQWFKANYPNLRGIL